MVAKPIVNAVKQYLQTVKGEGILVQQGVIFGSHITGQAHSLSDIDLLVVSPHFDKKRIRTDVDLLWRIAARTDNRIEPIPVGQRQFEEDDSSALIEIARREGQIVSLTE